MALVELVELVVVAVAVAALAAAVAAQPKGGMVALAEPRQDQLAGLLALRALEVRLAADQGRRLLAAMAIMVALAAQELLVRQADQARRDYQDLLAVLFHSPSPPPQPCALRTGIAQPPTSSLQTPRHRTIPTPGTFCWRPSRLPMGL